MASASSSSSFHSSSLALMDDDQIFCILYLLPPDSIISFSMTCRKSRSLASSESLWEYICRRDWGTGQVEILLASLTSRDKPQISWKTLYRRVSQLDSLSCSRLLSSREVIAPRSRASHSLNFVSDCLVIFGGGYEGGRHLDDMWVAHLGNGLNSVRSWNQVSSVTSIPSGRFGHSCTIVSDYFVLFGGINDNGDRNNDTWIGKLILQEEPVEFKISWMLLDVGPISPAPRGAHAACGISGSRVVIHGGIGLYGLRLGDTWVLDLADGFKSAHWNDLTDPQQSPPARSGHSLTCIGGSYMVLFGGRGSAYEALNDVWVFDGERFQWKEMKIDASKVPVNMPLPRVGHSAAFVLGGWLLIYGGEDSHRNRKNDFWILDVGMFLKPEAAEVGFRSKPLEKRWRKMKALGHSPGYRSFQGSCAHPSGRYLFVFGGMVDGVVHPDEAYSLRFDGELYLIELVLQL